MTPTPTGHHDEPRWYEIRVQGRLDARWAAWFDGLSILDADDGATLRGPVTDQAALHGLLQRVRDVGLPLLSVAQLRPDLTTTPTAQVAPDPATTPPAQVAPDRPTTPTPEPL